MIVWMKKILFKLLSQKAYLRTLHRAFYFLYNLGLLKRDARFKYHYLVKDLIEPNYSVVDIGANLGYFSRNFAILTPKGSLLSIEPVKPFYEVLSKFMKRYDHVTIINCALGQEEGTITMVLPETNGMIRTGLPHIAESEEEKAQHKTHDVPVQKGSLLLGKLEKIDYIKCDIEGYEDVVFQEIKPVIEKQLPIVQIEIDQRNTETMLQYFKDLGYIQYGVADFKIIQENGDQKEQGDYLFVHGKQKEAFETRMKACGRI